MVCGRNTDGDCRWTDSVIFCHNGSTFQPPQHLRIGDVIDIAGEPWALVKTNAGFDGAAHCFKPHRERDKVSAIVRRQRFAVQTIDDLELIKTALVSFDDLAAKVLAIPPLEQLLDVEIIQHRDDAHTAHKSALKLIKRLTRAKRHDASLTPVLEAVSTTQRLLRYQLADLNRYCASPANYWRRYLINTVATLPNALAEQQSDWAYWQSAASLNTHSLISTQDEQHTGSDR